MSITTTTQQAHALAPASQRAEELILQERRTTFLVISHLTCYDTCPARNFVSRIEKKVTPVMKGKLILLGVFTLLILFLALELFVLNRDFRRQHPNQLSAAWDKINKKIFIPIRYRLTDYAPFKNTNTDGNPWVNYPTDDPSENTDTNGNPWINYPTSPGLRIHPFLDHTHASTTKAISPKLDYFGFRNDTDLYFSNKRDYVLIVMTGNSEAVGFHHTKTIAQNLEEILNSKVKNTQFKVLNLAMSGYSVSSEINAYIHLAYQLKPEYVITHSGSADISNSIQIPEKFKKLGLFYSKAIETYWLPKLYDGVTMAYVPNLDPNASLTSITEFLARKTFTVYKNGLDQVVDSYIMIIKKFKTIVESNQGKFIVGIQPNKHTLELDKQIWLLQDNREEVVNLLIDLYSELKERARKLSFIVFNDFGEFEFMDFVHTNDSGSVKTAQIYAEKILEDFKE
jgi:hypothetical protein